MASQAFGNPPKGFGDSHPPPTNGFPKSNKKLVSLYMKEAKLVSKLTSHFKSLHLIVVKRNLESEPSNSQGSSDPLNAFAAELSTRNAGDQRQPAPPAQHASAPIKRDAPRCADEVELPPLRPSSGPPSTSELAKLYRELIFKLDIRVDNRFITITNPNLALSQQEIRDFRRLVRCIKIKPRGIKVLSELPANIQPISIVNFEGEAFVYPKMWFSDFSYVRKNRAYWVTPKGKNGSARRANGYLIEEIPTENVLPEDRRGFHLHLVNERADDVNNAEDTSEEEKLRLTQLRNNVELWINREPQTKQSLSCFLLHTYSQTIEDKDPSASSKDNEQSQSMDLEEDDQMQSLINSLPPPRDVPPPRDEEIENILDSGNNPADSGNSSESIVALSSPCSSTFMTEEEAIMESKISFMVDNPLEDEYSSPEGKKFSSEFLKIKPDLKACERCGDNLHTVQNCIVQSANDRDETSKYKNFAWFAPKEGSLAATGGSKMLSCAYLYCRNNSTHTTMVCPDLHQRCATCKVRGHDNVCLKVEDKKDPEGRAIVYETNCPVVKNHYIKTEKICSEWEITCPSYQELQEEFERQAPLGIFTRYRFNDAGAGWYPAMTEKDIKVIRALGYRSLERTTAEESVALLSSIHNLLSGVFVGTGNISFESFPDEKWTIIHQRRDAKRSLKKEESKQNKAAKKAENTAARNARLPRDNSPGSFVFGHPSGRPRYPPSRARNRSYNFNSEDEYSSTFGGRSRSRSPQTDSMSPTPQATVDRAGAHQPAPVAGPSNPVRGVTPPHGGRTSRANRPFGYTYSREDHNRWEGMYNNPSGRQSGFRPNNHNTSSGTGAILKERIPKISQGKSPHQ